MSLEKKIRNLEVKINLIAVNLNMNELWKNISEYETKERKHESSNTLLSEARADDRMIAYIKIMERKLNE